MASDFDNENVKKKGRDELLNLKYYCVYTMETR